MRKFTQSLATALSFVDGKLLACPGCGSRTTAVASLLAEHAGSQGQPAALRARSAARSVPLFTLLQSVLAIGHGARNEDRLSDAHVSAAAVRWTPEWQRPHWRLEGELVDLLW